ncbi:hypothetical protein E8E13_009439 [Curvularia kusanoi]|uniref:RING-type domain-containing protein n=1 Tax=Curvularia kusanoi TaxID=90978 RepID=A0A9P4THG9_CURKU|nr:hypothetical protein E8E13_009439 [Curvularia kusanoi]
MSARQEENALKDKALYEALAADALTYSTFHNGSLDSASQTNSTAAALPKPSTPGRHDSLGATTSAASAASLKQQTTGKLPSLLQYTDIVLMRTSHLFNNPPPTITTCAYCKTNYDNVSIQSDFLPLHPCNHWLHYRCLIWHVTRDDPNHDKCPVCKTPLFEYDGITALTLATRTDVPMGTPHNPSIGAVNPAQVVYEEDCGFIATLIEAAFHTQLRSPSPYPDKSPDLIACFNGVLKAITDQIRPRSAWLKWKTKTGSLLFAMLVAIKMRRYLWERQKGIVETEAWRLWEEGCREMQRGIWEEVARV